MWEDHYTISIRQQTGNKRITPRNIRLLLRVIKTDKRDHCRIVNRHERPSYVRIIGLPHQGRGKPPCFVFSAGAFDRHSVGRDTPVGLIHAYTDSFISTSAETGIWAVIGSKLFHAKLPKHVLIACALYNTVYATQGWIFFCSWILRDNVIRLYKTSFFIPVSLNKISLVYNVKNMKFDGVGFVIVGKCQNLRIMIDFGCLRTIRLLELTGFKV